MIHCCRGELCNPSLLLQADRKWVNRFRTRQRVYCKRLHSCLRSVIIELKAALGLLVFYLAAVTLAGKLQHSSTPNSYGYCWLSISPLGRQSSVKLISSRTTHDEITIINQSPFRKVQRLLSGLAVDMR
jgi:hypothetical protein